MQAVAHGTTSRHSDRPSVLDRLDVLSDPPPILHVHRLQPFAHGLLTGGSAEEVGRNAFHRPSSRQGAYPMCTTGGTCCRAISCLALLACLFNTAQAQPGRLSMLTRRHILRAALTCAAASALPRRSHAQGS